MRAHGALPGGIGASGGTSNINYNGFDGFGVLGLTAASGDFNRSIGPGVDQVQWASAGGFAAFGADRAVNFGGGAGLVTWIFDLFFLAADDADKTVTVVNPIDLNVPNSGRVQVQNGTAAVDAIFIGELSGSSKSIEKFGNGTLALTATNTFGSGLSAGAISVSISAGTLQLGNDGSTGVPEPNPRLMLLGGGGLLALSRRRR